MSRFVVDEQNELKTAEVNRSADFPWGVRLAAKIIAFIFHPLLIPVYLSWFLLRVQPYFFSSFSELDRAMVIPRFFIMYTLFPLATVLLAKGLGFISSVYLRTQKERIIPYVACGLYYFWMWYVLRNQPQFPPAMVAFSLAVFIASSLGLLANIYFKISMHTMAVGMMATFMCLLAFSQGMSFGVYVSIAILITGIVCTARLITSDHTQKEIYAGLIVGCVSQLIAWQFN